jgi:hypothetical protein
MSDSHAQAIRRSFCCIFFLLPSPFHICPGLRLRLLRISISLLEGLFLIGSACSNAAFLPDEKRSGKACCFLWMRNGFMRSSD